MTRDGLQRALIDLGWMSLMKRALGVRPAEVHALRQLMRYPGMALTYAQMAAEYPGNNRGDAHIKKRVERARSALRDVGCDNAIQTLVGGGGYVIQMRDALRIERAILAACGIEIQEAA